MSEKEILPAGKNETVDMVLYNDVRNVLDNARKKTFAAINSSMVEAYWDVGRIIVEKQGGAERATYGDGLIKSLSKHLVSEYGRGFDERNLRFMRQFYITLPNRNALRTELSWTHYRLIMRVEKPQAREYYLEECIKGIWSTRQLERQINSLCYERLLAGRDDGGVIEEAVQKEPPKKTEDIIKDPYVLEFLGLRPNTKYYETELEQGLIDHMQKFLLELGQGFTFEARQKRISLDGDHFYIDLVFYNYILRCFVLIDIKAGKLTHQDIGQMQMYVNYHTRELMNEGDGPPIGIILCADKNESVVKYTFPEEGNKQIFASKYKLHLPTEEELALELSTERDMLMRERTFGNNG
ncbi:MAG: PDDEXK nuclease domain-containing protein [Methanomassiliicoccaceae archaeon]|nr:PDDEXK nuclease domain-containing protein [Methanomassiliicoccaceae archaeon]MCL2145610.1 PDDEXK nuclease domain-containing protein [Methanomassiliicoccaceae archaeon]